MFHPMIQLTVQLPQMIFYTPFYLQPVLFVRIIINYLELESVVQ
jgi:hypothetical protein